MSTRVTRDDALRRFRLVGLWLPLAILALAVAVQVAFMPSLPATIATHWNAAGEPDGFSATWSFPLVTFLIGAGTIALVALSALAGTKQTEGAVDLRFVSAVTLGLAGLLGVLSVGLLVGQVGLEDPSTATAGWQLAVAGGAVGVLLGVIGWRASLRFEGDGPAASTPDALPLGQHEKAVWLRTATMSRGALLGMGAAGVASVAGAVAAVLAGGPGAWTAVLAVVLLLVAALVTAVFRVRVDTDGVQVRSALGWPRTSIPRSDIRLAQVVSVNPMAEYGGWGSRHSATHGQGVVTRTGEALRITRTNGRQFTVTVDDATTAAALLRTYQEREAQ